MMASRLPEVIADAAGLVLAGTGDLTDRLRAVLDGRDMVVILDNCEHVVAAAAGVAEAVLGSTVGPRVLVTSREPLGLVDEVQVRVEPLPTGDRSDDAAMRLLTTTAARVGATIGDADAEIARELCRRLDGLPLSLELAGAQLRGLNIRSMVARLDARFELLTRDGYSGNRRQASLAAVLDGTWSMLTGGEQLLLGQLAAFPAGFDIDAVEAVTATLLLSTPLRTLTRLTDLGLVSTDGDRYRLLETVKLFVQQRTDQPRHDDLHARWCLDHVSTSSIGDQFLSRPVLRWVCAHHDDLLAAEHHFLTAGDQTAVATLVGAQCGALDTGLGSAKAAGTIERIQRHLDGGIDDPHDQAVLNLAAAFAGRSARRPDWIVNGAQRAAALFEASGDDIGLSAALILRSWMAALRDTDTALELVDRAIQAAERGGSPTFARFARTNRVVPLIAGLRFEEAADELDRVRPLLQSPPDDFTSTFFDNYQCINDIFFNPARIGGNVPLLYERESEIFASPDSSLLIIALGAAGAGDAHWTHRLIEESIEHIRRASNDDGLPDVLVPIAVLAWRLDDVAHARRLLTTVRHAGRPTSNIGITIGYRGLRQIIGVDDHPPPDLDLTAELRDARSWLHSLIHPQAASH